MHPEFVPDVAKTIAYGSTSLPGEGWKRTDELETGEALATSSGLGVRVVSVTETSQTEPTFNFEVADFHTYFVGEHGVWVHNANCDIMAAQGKAGEAKTREKLGDSIAGEQVSFKTSDGTRTRTDFVTTDTGVVETKTGNAKLTKGQQKLSDDIKAGKKVTPVGENARKAGLEPGVPVRMTSCHVDRC